MTIVFNKADTVSYLREQAPFEEVATGLDQALFLVETSGQGSHSGHSPT
jgi:hypothetical protein